MIRVSNLTVRFGEVEAVRSTTFELAGGDRLGVVGPNGSGKSTLLRALAGLIEPTTGKLERTVTRRIVLVHQSPYLFRGTSRDNVALGARLAGRRAADVDGWLERLGAQHIAERSGKALSGGERRRVAVARALAADPDVLLLDEPFAALDEEGVATMRAALAAFDRTLVVAGPALDPELGLRVHALS